MLLYLALLVLEIPKILSLENPVIVTMIVLVFIITVIYVILSYFYYPKDKKHRLEKLKLERINSELSEILLEMDPNPIIRIDHYFNIIFLNKSAKRNFNEGDLELIIGEIQKENNTELEAGTYNNKYLELEKKIGNEYFTLNIIGEKKLKIFQIYFKNISDKIKREKDLKLYNDKVSKLTHQFENKFESERNIISSELHDSLGQKLSLCKMMFNNNGSIETKELINLIDAAICETRTISHRLKPIDFSDRSLKDILNELVIKYDELENISGNFKLVGSENNLENEIKLNLLRITQECLNNIIKHSCAENFEVFLSFEDEMLSLIISDNGKGFNISMISKGKFISSGIGLVNIQERVKNLNGEIDFDSEPGKGTNILIEIPLSKKDAKQSKSIIG